jgi:hypothetical protein
MCKAIQIESSCKVSRAYRFPWPCVVVWASFVVAYKLVFWTKTPNIASVKNSLKYASAEALNPTRRHSWNRRGCAQGIDSNAGLVGTSALHLIDECNKPRWISSLVSLSSFSGPGTVWVGGLRSSRTSPVSSSRSWISISGWKCRYRQEQQADEDMKHSIENSIEVWPTTRFGGFKLPSRPLSRVYKDFITAKGIQMLSQ